MVDRLAEVVALLRPRAPFTKVVSGAGRWGVRRTEYGHPFYCVILEGLARLSIDGQELTALEAGDFVLIPSTPGFAMTSSEPPPPEAFSAMPLLLPNGEYRHGDSAAAADIRFLVGHWVFDSPDTALLVSLLPRWVHVRAEPRLSMIVQLVGDESRAQRPARDVIMEHLLEVLMIEALRSSSGSAAPPDLLRGLADERLAVALRRMHQSPSEPWTVAQLAKESALSRSTFFGPLPARLGCGADGRPAGLANGAGQTVPARPARWCCRRGGQRWLQLGEHLHRCVHTPRRVVASAIRARDSRTCQRLKRGLFGGVEWVLSGTNRQTHLAATTRGVPQEMTFGFKLFALLNPWVFPSSIAGRLRWE